MTVHATAQTASELNLAHIEERARRRADEWMRATPAALANECSPSTTLAMVARIRELEAAIDVALDAHHCSDCAIMSRCDEHDEAIAAIEAARGTP